MIGQSQSKEMDTKLPLCWYIEKTPSYSRSCIYVAPIYANLYPKIKLLLLVRDPVNQLISFNSYDDTSSNIDTNISTEAKIYNYYKTNLNFYKIRKLCNIVLNKMKHLTGNNNETKISKIGSKKKTNDIGNISEWNNILRYFMTQYLYNAMVKHSINTRDISDRLGLSLAATMHVTSLIFYIYAYDEAFGFGNWNQFRIMQYEWIFDKNTFAENSSNVFNALAIIKCWLQMDISIQFDTDDSSDHNGENYYTSFNAFSRCPDVFFGSQRYYNQLKFLINQEKAKRKLNSKTKKTVVDTYHRELLANFYEPLVKLFLVLMKQRKEVLLGGWVQWQTFLT